MRWRCIGIPDQFMDSVVRNDEFCLNRDMPGWFDSHVMRIIE